MKFGKRFLFDGKGSGGFPKGSPPDVLKVEVSRLRGQMGRIAVDFYILSRQYFKEGGDDVLMGEVIADIDESILMREMIRKHASEKDWDRLRDFLGTKFDEHFSE